MNFSTIKTKEKKVTKLKVTPQTQEPVEVESQVVVHGTYTSLFGIDKVRIWKTTFLIARDSDHQSELISAFNITLYPQWTTLSARQTLRFTLIFEGLPKSCRSFDLVEVIPEPGGFVKRNIPRNSTDVYRISMR